MDIVDILGVGLREDSYTDLIYNACEFISKFRNNLIKHLTNTPDTDGWECYRRTKVSLKDGEAIPDLVFINMIQNKVIVIENKILAKEGKEQTVRYASNEFKDAVVNKYQLRNAAFYYFFLTPDGRQAKSTAFTPITYAQVASLLPKVLPANRNLSLLLKEFQCRATEYVKPEDDMVALKYLNDIKGLTTQYSNFYRMVDHFGLDYFKVRKSSTNNKGSGRIPVTKFSLPHWTGSEYKPDEDGFNCFDIHIELQWDTNKNTENLSVQLHYQTNPGFPYRELKSCSQWFQSSFLMAKSAMLLKLNEQKHRLYWIKIRNYPLRLASYKFDKHATIGEVKAKVREFTMEIVPIVNEVLKSPVLHPPLPKNKEAFYHGIRFVTLELKVFKEDLGLEYPKHSVVLTIGADDPSDLDTKASDEFAVHEIQTLLGAFGCQVNSDSMRASEIYPHGQSLPATREYKFTIKQS